MKNDSLVSIIIPAYNARDTIDETLQSCLNQTWENIEILIIDDGSTDNTLEVVQRFSDKRLKLFLQQNKGACAARNLGIKHALGHFIQFLDADDLLSSSKIEDQVKLLEGKDNAIASCAWGRFYKDISSFKIAGAYLNRNYSNPINWLVDSWSGKGMGTCSIWLTPFNIIKKAGPWNENLSINQDGEYFARVLIQADEILFSKGSLVYYRSDILNSISRSPFNISKANSLLESYKLYTKAIPDSFYTPEIKKALARNYADIIYRLGKQYPSVEQEAWTELIKLDTTDFEPVGGKFMRLLHNVLGFKTAIAIRKLRISLFNTVKS